MSAVSFYQNYPSAIEIQKALPTYHPSYPVCENAEISSSSNGHITEFRAVAGLVALGTPELIKIESFKLFLASCLIFAKVSDCFDSQTGFC